MRNEIELFLELSRSSDVGLRYGWEHSLLGTPIHQEAIWTRDRVEKEVIFAISLDYTQSWGTCICHNYIKGLMYRDDSLCATTNSSAAWRTLSAWVITIEFHMLSIEEWIYSLSALRDYNDEHILPPHSVRTTGNRHKILTKSRRYHLIEKLE